LCDFQIRFPTGQQLKHTFSAQESLAAVRLYVEINKPGDLGTFSLMTSFPKKVFQDEDYEKPLDKLGKYFVLSHVLYITTPIHFICILLFLYILISLPNFDGIEAWKKYIYIYTLCVVVE
jgi:hypothetical protein